MFFEGKYVEALNNVSDFARFPYFPQCVGSVKHECLTKQNERNPEGEECILFLRKKKISGNPIMEL